MTRKRPGRMGLWSVVVGASLAALAGCSQEAAPTGSQGSAALTSASAGPKAAATTGDALAQQIRDGEPSALKKACEQVCAAPEGDPKPVDDAQVTAWLSRLEASNAVFPRLTGQGKYYVLDMVGGMIARLSVEGTSRLWPGLLSPIHDVVVEGMSDRDPAVRSRALSQLNGCWIWSPGRAMTGAEEQELGRWKEAFHPTVLKRLADPEPAVRIAAAQCLGHLPLDGRATPALALLNDSDFSVRLAVVAAFAGRSDLLTEDALLPLLHDPVPDLRGLAERILTNRGLDPGLIGMGRMITSSEPAMRVSVIPFLKENPQVDASVWLLRLTEDEDEGVRLKAVEALGQRLTPEAAARLREMARSDASDEVRAAAAKHVPEAPRTVSLPPLPGSPSLAPKAN